MMDKYTPGVKKARFARQGGPRSGSPVRVSPVNLGTPIKCMMKGYLTPLHVQEITQKYESVTLLAYIRAPSRNIRIDSGSEFEINEYKKNCTE
jgi:hypothetical protein